MNGLDRLRLPTRRYALGLGYATAGLAYFKYWILAIAALAFLVPLALAPYLDIELSGWYYAASGGKWFTVFVGAGFLYTLLPIMVAAGLTRREFTVAMGVFALAWSAGLGAFVVAGLMAERLYYGALGWSQGLDVDGAAAPIGSWADTAAFAGAVPLLYLVHFVAGAAVGAAAYRWEKTGWLVAVPILPIVSSLDNALSGAEPVGPGWMGFFGRYLGDWGAGAVLAAVALAVAAVAVFTYRVLIDVPIRSKQA